MAMSGGSNIVEVLASMLKEFTRQNDKRNPGQVPGAPTMFDAYQVPDISIKKYFFRLEKYFGCSDECYVYSLILIDRLINRNPKLYLSSRNVHRLLSAGIVVSAKLRDDSYYSNKYYSSVAGIRLIELNYLEMQFLLLIDFNLYVEYSEFCRYITEIMNRYGPIRGRCVQYIQRNDEDMDEEEEEEEYEEVCKLGSVS